MPELHDAIRGGMERMRARHQALLEKDRALGDQLAELSEWERLVRENLGRVSPELAGEIIEEIRVAQRDMMIQQADQLVVAEGCRALIREAEALDRISSSVVRVSLPGILQRSANQEFADLLKELGGVFQELQKTHLKANEKAVEQVKELQALKEELERNGAEIPARLERALTAFEALERQAKGSAERRGAQGVDTAQVENLIERMRQRAEASGRQQLGGNPPRALPTWEAEIED
jgi:hypothetical protein